MICTNTIAKACLLLKLRLVVDSSNILILQLREKVSTKASLITIVANLCYPTEYRPIISILATSLFVITTQ